MRIALSIWLAGAVSGVCGVMFFSSWTAPIAVRVALIAVGIVSVALVESARRSLDL